MQAVPVEPRQFVRGFLIAGPTLAIAARVGDTDVCGTYLGTDIHRHAIESQPLIETVDGVVEEAAASD